MDPLNHSSLLAPVSIGDVSQVLRIVRNVCDHWDDPQAWREQLLVGACELLEGNVGSMHALEFNGSKLKVLTVATAGLPAPLASMIYSSSQELGMDRDIVEATTSTPSTAKLFEDYHRFGWATASRQELVDNETYYSSEMYLKFRQPLDCDDHVVSVRSVDIPERAEIIDIDRPHGAVPFGPREVALLKLLHDEIAPLIGLRLTTEEHLSRDGLSKRLRETLSLLLEGRSEKEVGATLNLKPGTVHEYVMKLYNHFQVNSRAELLAYFIRRRPKQR